MKMFLDFIEKGAPATTFFDDVRSGIAVRIGSENNHNAMEDFSVITATYSAGEIMKGSIAIIGPTRMDYGRVITLLDLLSSDLSRELARLTIGGGTQSREGTVTMEKNEEELEDSCCSSRGRINNAR